MADTFKHFSRNHSGTPEDPRRLYLVKYKDFVTTVQDGDNDIILPSRKRIKTGDGPITPDKVAGSGGTWASSGN